MTQDPQHKRLSYVMTTYNKVEYLKQTLPALVQACRPNEEIIIVDGGSTDGTRELLEKEFEAGRIHQFVSEKDFGEAHGTNKAFLLAKGEYIKVITDDDAFHFGAFEAALDYMDQHPHIDLMGSEGASLQKKENGLQIVLKNDLGHFEHYKAQHTPFVMTGLSYLIRRSALPLLGLFNTNYRMVDMEYSLRVMSGKAGIAFCKIPFFVNIVNPNSNSVRLNHILVRELYELQKKYVHDHRTAHRSKYYKSRFVELASGIKRSVIRKEGQPAYDFDFAKAYVQSLDYLQHSPVTSADFIS